MKKNGTPQTGIPDDKKLPGRIYEEGAHYDSLGRMVVNFDSDTPERAPAIKEDAECFKTVKLLGKTLFIKFSDLSQSTYEQRRELSAEWGELTAWALKPYIIMLLLCFAAAAFTFMESISVGFVRTGILVLFILTYTMIKLNELPGFIMHIALNIVWMFFAFSGGNPFVSAFAGLALVFMTFISLMCIICLVNFKLYRALSKLDGFPSFIQNTGDIYGGALHETDIVTQQRTAQQAPQPEPQKGWNAFDYLDTQTPKGDNSNENGN